MIGRTLSHFEIIEAIGRGGMGEVYKAKDTRLDRTVAIKVLPPHLAGHPELKQRLEREARAISSLNHPHICTLHDIGEQDGTPFLVMEYVEGETLADRIKRGPVPLDEALPFFKQIAEALEAAHEKGIVHRDLKPANIKVTPEDKVKVLDFGLAKALVPEEPAEDSSQSPTLTKGTALGAIMGTAAYMSPEQARGKPVDKRTDVWAFGCCLYEALTGRKAFSGETVTDTLAAIVKNEPDWKALPGHTPVKIRELMRRCLQKDRNRRLHDVADARIEIDEATDEPDIDWQDEARAKKRHAPAILAALVGILIGALLGAWVWSRLEARSVDSASSPLVTRSVIDLPPEASVALGGPVPQIGFESLALALSPDGTKLVYVGGSADGKRLYQRAADSFEIEPISGTEGAIFAFFSPDGSWVGFLTDNQVKKVSLQGGAPVTLCDARTPVRADWTRANVIYFAEDQASTLSQVPSAGGPPSQIAKLPRGQFHQVLPCGKSALVGSFVQNGISGDYENIGVFSFETQSTKTLINSGYSPRYVPSGHLLFARSNDLLAVPFDLELAVHVGDVNDYVWVYDIPRQEGRKLATAGKAGWPVWMPDAKTISYVSWQPGEDRAIRRQRVDTPGSEEELFSSQPLAMISSWSPNGHTVAFSEFREMLRLRFFTAGQGRQTGWQSSVGSNVWGADFSPDGQWIAYHSDETGRYEVFLQSFPGGDIVRQVSVDGGVEPLWNRETGELFYRRGNQWFSTRVTLQPELSWDPPRLAFETDFIDTPGRSYDVSPDGQRLLVVKRTREPIRTKIHIVHNWFDELERLVPTEHN